MEGQRKQRGHVNVSEYVLTSVKSFRHAAPAEAKSNARLWPKPWPYLKSLLDDAHGGDTIDWVEAESAVRERCGGLLFTRKEAVELLNRLGPLVADREVWAPVDGGKDSEDQWVQVSTCIRSSFEPLTLIDWASADW